MIDLRDRAQVVPRRRILRALGAVGFSAVDLSAAALAAPRAHGRETAHCVNWPAWHSFRDRFIPEGGRVIDPSSPRAHTVSEGQAYALFFALVAGDRARFEALLRWTEDNLAGGDLSKRLPAWQWGRRDDGSYGVLDANAASDADLWLSYVLGEAGRLWQERRYLALASLLAERVLREETAVLPGLGRTLLPGNRGFVLAPDHWRLNPSYAPPFLLRWIANRSADARWQEVLASSHSVLTQSAPRGFAPDWTVYEAPGEFEANPSAPPDRNGSYNAIRVYLWLGMTSRDDGARAQLLRHFAPMAELVDRVGLPPETIDIFDGATSGTGPSGFSAALLPFLESQNREAALHTQELRLKAQPAQADAYYDQALCLFGMGWRERRFAFAADGGLVLPAETQVQSSCATGASAPGAAR